MTLRRYVPIGEANYLREQMRKPDLVFRTQENFEKINKELEKVSSTTPPKDVA
jgi:hypothetical protein